MSESASRGEQAASGTPAPPAKDPMKGFRGVQAGTLVLEAIVVGLALPVVAQLGDGLESVQGWTVGGIAVALLACSALLRFSWSIWVILALNVVLVAFVVTLPWVTVIGVLFLAVWGWLMWLRRDVARRMAEGRLASQQPSGQADR
ncbi:DUF4233 domain-containing protein [Saccharomonospora xinjiangensis]|uniref:DUF4233 domain-containing protein n=1 Tax=Saccharomonospora xinjiangensis XJ-54 TaxID=882086 RepID=I0UYN5_9PSEU|nr:DUF4233 domain-containing protein [Saccharomonospora xinjiangensis]EID52988.1 hypothetical protein SacxiDRAFT_0719 [Saccharomonospora xinjiangensis XJ-54]